MDKIHLEALKLEEDRQFWSRNYGREVSIAEVEEIRTNLLGFARTLINWEIRKKLEERKL